MAVKRCHLDFETYCDIDLLQHGAARYFADPSFRVLMSAWAFDNGPVYQCEGMVPVWTWNPLPETFHAFNASFEIRCLAHHGVSIDLVKWRDTQAHAYARSFSGNLGKVGEQLCLPFSMQKMTEGKRLINKFSTPKSGKWDKESAPADWDLFLTYNRIDVEAEREISRILDKWPWTKEEQDLWMWDHGINKRGVPVDMDLVSKAIDTAQVMESQINQQVKQLTGGINAGQVAKLLAWAQQLGYPHDNLRAETISEFLRTEE